MKVKTRQQGAAESFHSLVERNQEPCPSFS
jgi:hypothetical protein